MVLRRGFQKNLTGGKVNIYRGLEMFQKRGLDKKGMEKN